MAITNFYAGLLALLFVYMTLDTVRARMRHDISLGHGENNEIQAIVSAHSNFVAYVPFFLILSYLLEVNSFIAVWMLHTLCIVFTLGRFLHYFAMTAGAMNFKYRKWGMQLTVWPTLILGLLNIAVHVWMELVLHFAWITS